ncbi:type III-B CRISPR module RAMP protein Cmr4 [Sulfurimonas sp. SWIR-19]|uniref:type III-B CRISPR module RAMP protein Cmr4 n=1 Tax=Sulfurimonas sp. SWIR-19 TaxID=2878390 RepID=UPI001CF547BB|nr:type III-B CRISPR module RAMP protein Cmr4 [Sulfurimonas sp. SWIR-19]UCN01255.1 type III-B CRISPR module RAMP protein Cmr4 [Sulfurimonas sp. SWIR-19]
MKVELYTIKTLTNLHVGSGDINFNIIDNQVQKDAISNLPNINSSSLKGAFREHFSQRGKSFVNYVFGPPNSSNEHQSGAYSFFEAKLLARPVRSNKKPYVLASSPEVIEEFLSMLQTLGVVLEEELIKQFQWLASQRLKNEALYFGTLEDMVIEDNAHVKKSDEAITKVQEFFGEEFLLMCHQDFCELDLPVNARNALENGISQNLWYEEVVPSKTLFYFFIAKPNNIDASDEDNVAKFDRSFEKEEIIQIGANKTIGYGVCEITKVGS